MIGTQTNSVLADAPFASVALLDFNPIAYDPNTVIFSWVVFGVVVAILAKFAWRPLCEKLEERENRIASGLEEAEKAREEARRISEDFDAKVKEAQNEARRIADEARANAERIASEIETKARDRAAKLVENARNEIAAAQLQAVEEVRRSAVELSMAAAEAVVKSSLDDEKNRALAANVIDSVGRGSA